MRDSQACARRGARGTGSGSCGTGTSPLLFWKRYCGLLEYHEFCMDNWSRPNHTPHPNARAFYAARRDRFPRSVFRALCVSRPVRNPRSFVRRINSSIRGDRVFSVSVNQENLPQCPEPTTASPRVPCCSRCTSTCNCDARNEARRIWRVKRTTRTRRRVWRKAPR